MWKRRGREDQPGGGYRSPIETEVPLAGSSWIAVRCFAQAGAGGLGFAHTAPWHFDIAGQPLHPLRREAEFFQHRVEEEIERNRGILTELQLAEYQEALAAWKVIAAQSR